jgi:hypothetical protein
LHCSCVGAAAHQANFTQISWTADNNIQPSTYQIKEWLKVKEWQVFVRLVVVDVVRSTPTELAEVAVYEEHHSLLG